VWRWDARQQRWSSVGRRQRKIDASQAEEYYGLYFVRRALSIDPTYQPVRCSTSASSWRRLPSGRAAGEDAGRAG